MALKGKTTFQNEPEVKDMLMDFSKVLKVTPEKLINKCLLHGLLDLNSSTIGRICFK